MEEIFSRHLPWFITTGGTILGAVLAALFVIRYKVPDLSQRVKKLEEANDMHNQFVKKDELYAKDGQLRYQLQRGCLFLRGQCAQENKAVFEDIKNLVTRIDMRIDEMEENRQNGRTLLVSFISAVKEKMDLKFEIPESLK